MPRRERRAAPRAGNVVLGATVGGATLAARLAVLDPLRAALAPRATVLVDDGTLAGPDRVTLARRCGDPELLTPVAVARGDDGPDTPAWALLLTALDRRHDTYWVLVGEAAPAAAVERDLLRAIAANRSFALVDTAAPRDLEPHLAALATDGWPYLAASSALIGLAAGGDGRAPAAAILARLRDLLGAARTRSPDIAAIAASFLLAREPAPIVVPFAARTAR